MQKLKVSRSVSSPLVLIMWRSTWRVLILRRSTWRGSINQLTSDPSGKHSVQIHRRHKLVSRLCISPYFFRNTSSSLAKPSSKLEEPWLYEHELPSASSPQIQFIVTTCTVYVCDVEAVALTPRRGTLLFKMYNSLSLCLSYNSACLNQFFPHIFHPNEKDKDSGQAPHSSLSKCAPVQYPINRCTLYFTHSHPLKDTLPLRYQNPPIALEH